MVSLCAGVLNLGVGRKRRLPQGDADALADTLAIRSAGHIVEHWPVTARGANR
jgi:hypothetical protein